MIEKTAATEMSHASTETGARKPWSSPEVIVSALRNTEANVTNFTDGTTPIYGPYGS